MLTRRYSHDAAKFIDKLDKKQHRQIEEKLDGLCQNPTPQDMGRLRGADYAYVDQGEFRIIYDVVEDDLIDVVVVGRRNDADVYKTAQRKL